MIDRSTTTRPRRPRRTIVTVLLSVLLTISAAGCTGEDADDGAEAGGAGAGGADVGGPVGDCETSVTVPEIDYRDSSVLTEQEQQVLAVFRGRTTSVLLEQNPVSCRGLVEVPALVDSEEFGAFEVKSFTHAEPEIRYDLVYFTERQPIDSTISETITARLSALAEPDTSLQVWTVANTLFLAVTAPADDPDAEAIVAHYDQLIAGEE